MSIQILKAKNNEKVLKVGNFYVNSLYNPSREAESFIKGHSNLLSDEIIHVIGLGLGYHIKELINKTNERQIIKILDINENLKSFIINEVKELKNNKRIKIYSKKDMEKFFSTINQSKDIIINKQYLKVCEDLEFKNIIEKFIISREAIHKFGEIMIENEKENLKLNSPSISKFLKKSSNSVKVIASAGPSLDVVIDDLKKYRESYEIYAVGSALKTLIKNEIYPDLIVIIDPQEVVCNQLRDYEELDIPLAYLSTASRWAVSKYKGPKYIFYNKENDSGLKVVTGKTVAVPTIDLAIKSGAKKIILAGQDLAYKNNKTHATGFEEMYDVEDNVIINDKTKNVVGVSGKMLNTNKGYLIFKENIENLIEVNKEIEFFNCSFGAEIKGAKSIELKKLF